MVESAPIESHADADFEYQSVEPWAIVCLLLGLLSPLAMIAPVIWIVPLLGLVAGGVALARIRREQERSGRALALIGVALSMLFIIAPTARLASAFILLRNQPLPIVNKFFEYLREGHPEKAVTLGWTPDYRAGLGDDLWLFFRSDAEAKRDLRRFTSQPPVRLLLSLGKDAQVRHYSTTRLGVSGNVAQVEYWYAVTFVDDDEKKKTFFVRLLMERKPTADPDLYPWRVKDFDGGHGPLPSK